MVFFQALQLPAYCMFCHSCFLFLKAVLDAFFLSFLLFCLNGSQVSVKWLNKHKTFLRKWSGTRTGLRSGQCPKRKPGERLLKNLHKCVAAWKRKIKKSVMTQDFCTDYLSAK